MSVEKAHTTIQNRIGGPQRLTFPEDWENSKSWKRAQTAPAECGSATAAEFDVLMGYTDSDELAHHRVLFTLLDGSLRAECPCDGYHYRDWCAHVAYLWWRWVRSDLAVTDLSTEQKHLSPPWWLSVTDREVGGCS
ncbi:hypothetical protein [Halorussus halophilus]|uniref:hypothetical protein n=1 Tax=Halorussus halophilus TaxID=2650975 RepID=UPI001300FBD6|nr:hypothetical protein [Halorussus halophilus]